LAESNVIAEVDKKQRAEQTRVIHALLKQPFSRIIYASSASVYPETSSDPHREEETIALDSLNNEYRKSKTYRKINSSLIYSSTYGVYYEISFNLVELTERILPRIDVDCNKESEESEFSWVE